MRKKGHVDKTVGTHSNARLSRKACPYYKIFVPIKGSNPSAVSGARTVYITWAHPSISGIRVVQFGATRVLIYM